MKKKKLKKKFRRLKKCLRIAEENTGKENGTKISGIKYYATKEEIAEAIRKNRRCQSVKSF